MATLVAGTEANDEEIKQIMAEWSILHRSGDRLADSLKRTEKKSFGVIRFDPCTEIRKTRLGDVR